VVGEIGEYANLRKKFERGDIKIGEFQALAMDELADVMIYLDLLAYQLGIQLDRAVVLKFNKTSIAQGLDILIDADISDAKVKRSIATQSEEFDAVDALSKEYGRIKVTAIVDDDYPSVRSDYEYALMKLIDALRKNLRLLPGE